MRTERARLPAALAWTVAVLAIAMVGIALILWAARGFGALPVSFGRTAFGVIGLVVAPLTYTTFGALLAARIPRNPVGWLLLACGFLLATMLPVNLLVAIAHESLRPPEPGLVAVAWLRNTFATPGVLTLLIVAVFVFPEGRPINARWSIGIVTAIAAGALLAIGAALNPLGMVTYPTLPNPTGASPRLATAVTAISVTGVTLAVVAAVHAVASIAVRYRSGGEERRAQLKWILLASMVTAFAVIPFLMTRYLLDVGNTLGEIASLGIQLAMSTFPIAAALAISRYRLYDVDLLIGRTLVYVPLMAILGGLYTAGIAVFQRLFVAFTGKTSDVAIILTALIVASIFTPLRKLLEGALERRFPTMPDRAASVAEKSPAALPALAATSVPIAEFRAVGKDDRIDCPIAGSQVGLSACLECPQLRAITRPPTRGVVCEAVPRSHVLSSPGVSRS
jgi:hypothetical protein